MYSGDLSDLVLITTPPSLGFLGSSDAEKKTKLMPSTSESNAEVENSHAKSVPHQVDISPTPLTPPTSPKGALHHMIPDFKDKADSMAEKHGASVPGIPLEEPNQESQLKDRKTEGLPHRSHDPSNNLKRSDPFKFGSRYLQEDDDVFEFNAWDHVTPDESYYAYAEEQYAHQRASPVSDFDKHRFNSDPAKWWNKFYSNNTSNFFKNRKWLHQEFPILSKLTTTDAGPSTILEVGAGAGNTAFPILAANENPKLIIHACDFSNKAVDLIKANEAYDPQQIKASVWDISSDELPPDLTEESVDVVLLIFIFSALNPLQWDAAVKNVWRALRPGGEVCFRDYGRGDLTQVRFKKGRLMGERFYIRGDGTRVYFFEEKELRSIWSQNSTLSESNGFEDGKIEEPKTKEGSATGLKPDFDVVSLGVDRRMLVNRQRQLKMYRCWMQGRFKKTGNLKPD